jgi:hypothetical protein
MYLRSPQYRPVRMLLAFVIAWPLAGVVWALPGAIPFVIASADTHSLGESILDAMAVILVSAFIVATGTSPPHMGGPPPYRYALVLCVMGVLMIFATGMIQRGKRPQL